MDSLEETKNVLRAKNITLDNNKVFIKLFGVSGTYLGIMKNEYGDYSALVRKEDSEKELIFEVHPTQLLSQRK